MRFKRCINDGNNGKKTKDLIKRSSNLLRFKHDLITNSSRIYRLLIRPLKRKYNRVFKSSTLNFTYIS